MEKSKYKCRNTGNQHGLQLWEVCPDCGNRDCLEVHPIKPRIPWKIIAFFLIPLFILFLIRICSNKRAETIWNSRFNVNCLLTDSSTGAKFVVSPIDPVAEGSNTELSITSIADLYIRRNGKERKINDKIKNNIFYPCEDELGVLTLVIRPKSGNEINGTKDASEIQIDIPGNNGASNPKAVCPPKLKFKSISEILPGGKIVVSLDSVIHSLLISKKIKVFISLTGTNGPFEEKLIWQVCDGSKNPLVLNVHGYIENQGDTIAYPLNGDTRSRSIACFPPDPEKANSCARNFMNQLNGSFENGDILNIVDPLYSYSSKRSFRVLLNGRLLSGGIRELEMILLNEQGDFRNDGQKRNFIVTWTVNSTSGLLVEMQIRIIKK